MHSYRQYQDEFSQNGFLIVKEYLTSQEVMELATNLQRYVGQVVPTLPPSDVFYDVTGRPETLKSMFRMEQHDPFFRALPERSKFVRMAESLLGTPVVSHGVEFFDKPARVGKETPPHQDGFYFCLVPSEALTLLFPMDVVNQENGCIRYVPGSHKKGIRPHSVSHVLGFSQSLTDWSPQDEVGEFKAAAVPGDLLTHHCDTIHRADSNTSSRSRRAMVIVYYAARAVSDQEAIARQQRSAAR